MAKVPCAGRMATNFRRGSRPRKILMLPQQCCVVSAWEWLTLRASCPMRATVEAQCCSRALAAAVWQAKVLCLCHHCGVAECDMHLQSVAVARQPDTHAIGLSQACHLLTSQTLWSGIQTLHNAGLIREDK